MYLNIKCFSFLVNQGNFVEASNQLDKALETVSLENINKTAVLRLKSGLEAQGQTIKYDVNLFKKKACIVF